MTGTFATGWRQVAACFVMLATIAMIASCWSIVAVPLLDEFKPSRFVLGQAMFMLSGASALISPFLGSLMDRVSLKRLMLAGGALLAAGYAAISLAGEFWHILAIFAVLIAPANVLLGPVASTVLLSRWFVKRRGLALGIAIAGVGAGSIVYPMIIQGLLNTMPWREAFLILALILLAVTTICALLIVNRPSDVGLHPDGASEPPAAARSSGEVQQISAREVLTDPTFWLCVIVFGLVTSGMKGMVTNLSPMALDNGVTATAAAGLISIYGLSGFVSKGFFAALSDRVNSKVLMIGSLCGFAAGMAVLTQAHLGYQALFLGIVLTGLFGGMMVPMQSFLMPRIFGERVVGKAFGLVSGTTLLLLMSTPSLFGLIFDKTGSYASIFLTFTGLALAAILAVLAMRLHPRGQLSGKQAAEAFADPA